MTDFNNIVKKKLEQFDVPFNEAHWNEMDAKLNKAQRWRQLKKGIVISLGVVAILSVSSYLYFSETQVEKKALATQNETLKEIIVAAPTKTENQKNKNQSSPTIHVKEEEIISENNEITNREVEVNENKINNTPDEENSREDVLEIDKEETSVFRNENSQAPSAFSEFDFLVYNGNTCLGGEVSFEILLPEQPVTYLWNFGDGHSSTEANPKHIYEKSGNYHVSLTLIDKKTKERKEKVKENAVAIFPAPIADFSWTEMAVKHDNNKLKYPYTNFKVRATDTDQYFWKFSDGTTSYEENPSVLLKEKKTYKVTLITKNNYGCQNITKKEVEINNSMKLSVQSVIVPESEIAKNKVFIPATLLGWEVQFEMTIQDKRGNIVYKTSDKDAPWNGRLNNAGNILEEGTYVWTVITYDYKGKPYSQQGRVTLLMD